MRQTCLDMVYELAKKDKRIFFIGSDLSHGTLDQFKQEMPDRFFMEGVSEANVIGMAVGLAMEGPKPPRLNLWFSAAMRKSWLGPSEEIWNSLPMVVAFIASGCWQRFWAFLISPRFSWERSLTW